MYKEIDIISKDSRKHEDGNFTIINRTTNDVNVISSNMWSVHANAHSFINKHYFIISRGDLTDI